MNFHFNNWLGNKLTAYEGLNFEISSEEDFIKIKTYSPDKVYIVTKMLSDTKIFDDASTQPVQIMILCQENTMELAKTVFDDIASTWNMKSIIDDTEFIKFSFVNPVVLSNFNDIFAGYRSILYMTCSLYVMEGVADVTNITIDGLEVSVLGLNINYSMSTDTQQMNKEDENNFIASSIKSTSGFSISGSIILKNDEFTAKVLSILNETDTASSESDLKYGGNEDFVISFTINDTIITKNMKLTSLSLNTAPNQIPTCQIGFIK